MSKHYRIFEHRRVAVLLTFISGFLDGFSYLTQGGHFVGMQTGNLIMATVHLADGKLAVASTYLPPILAFLLGQVIHHFLREELMQRHIHWHRFNALLILLLTFVTAVRTPYVTSNVTVSLLSFVSSLQLSTFTKVRGLAYANMMMTGNLKRLALLLTKGISQKNKDLLTQASHIFFAIISFALGVYLAAVLSKSYHEYALYAVLLPLIAVNVMLYFERVE